MERDLSTYSEAYLAQPFEHIQIKYRKKALLANNEFQDRVVLEVGCGIDPLYNYINNYKHLVIVEPSAKFVKEIDSDCSTQDNVTLIIGTLEERIAELSKYEFDLIVVSSLLHEVENPQNFLSALIKLCLPHTIIHIDVPNAKSLHRIIGFESGIIKSIYEKSNTQVRMQQNNTFDINTLCELLSKSGFQVIKYGSYFIKPFTHKQMQKLLAQGIIEDNVLEGLYNLSKYLPEYGSEIYVQVKKCYNQNIV